METILYIGCFLDFQELHRLLKSYDRQVLYRTITHPHITFSYRPEEIPWELFGTKIKVRCIGYACDGENEALQVAFTDLSPDLQQLADQIAVPHITLSVAQNGRSVNSGKLHFHPIDPFAIEGIFGGMDADGFVRT